VPFRAVSGERSSWAASAEKRRISVKVFSSRASIPFSVSARRSSSSPVPRSAMRQASASASIFRAARDISSTGRSAARAMM
jgi:hypothetical protein